MYRVSAQYEWSLICKMWCNNELVNESRNETTYDNFLSEYGIKPIYVQNILAFFEFESEKHYLAFKLKYG